MNFSKHRSRFCAREDLRHHPRRAPGASAQGPIAQDWLIAELLDHALRFWLLSTVAMVVYARSGMFSTTARIGSGSSFTSQLTHKTFITSCSSVPRYGSSVARFRSCVHSPRRSRVLHGAGALAAQPHDEGNTRQGAGEHCEEELRGTEAVDPTGIPESARSASLLQSGQPTANQPRRRRCGRYGRLVSSPSPAPPPA